MRTNRLRRRERGSTMIVLLSVMVVCAGLSTAVLMTNLGRQQEANHSMHRERAFQMAEAGIDWAVAQIRIRNGAVPSTPTEQRTVSAAGDFRVRYTAGDANNRDDDGDGITDEIGEGDYVVLESTGRSGGVQRSVEVLMRKAVQVPTFDASIQFNVETPVLDVNGNAFFISGNDHDLDGNELVGVPAKPGIASPADVADILAQIPASRQDQIEGVGGAPSVAKVDPIDLDLIVEQASAAASVVLETGTHTPTGLGTPVVGGTEVVYADGDVHFSGGGGGAGVLVVDGDLTISGSFDWVGIVLVRGRVRLTGGGNDKRIVGVLAVGEEVIGDTDSTEISLSGTVDLLYSGEAVELAAQSLAVMTVLSWREVGVNP